MKDKYNITKRKQKRTKSIIIAIVVLLFLCLPMIFLFNLLSTNPQKLFISSTKGDIAVTKVYIDGVIISLESYKLDFNDYPPTELCKIGIEYSNEINEGTETLVIALSTENKKGPYIEWQEDQLENCDKDKHLKTPDNISIHSNNMYEFVDFWGNPIVYIHNKDYGKVFKYKCSNGRIVQVEAVKSKLTINYYNTKSFQLWSFGPNGINENGQGDDITNFIEPKSQNDK
jgi:hypothetical protein